MSDARQALEKLLTALGESARFVTSGRVPPVLPGLEVEGVGPVGTPVSAEDARRLIAVATRAPYGRGEETIVDTSVRRVWQIEPTRFELRNAAWKTHLAEIVDVVREEFAVRHKVRTQLYKLLIYEKGSFFAPHRDSEKTPGMFATLVVCLPSRYEGGTLVVEHDGQAERIDFGGKASEFEACYAAFYTDCRHEITPVTSGYRVCLVYNLAVAGKARQPSAPTSSSAVERAARLLEEVFQPDDMDKLAIPFEHQYTEAGLDPRHLKGSDRARADVLVRAAESLDYQCYLALLTHRQSGEVNYATWGSGSWGSGRWSDDDDGDEYGDEDNDMDAEMGEVYDEEFTLDHWVDPRGRKQALGVLGLEEEEVLGNDDREGWSVRQEVHEATGNEGVSMERWYRQCVLVIWPRDRHFRILAGEGQAVALPALERMAARARRPDALAACRTFAGEIIDHWRPQHRYVREKSLLPGRMLRLLDRLGDADFVRRFLRDVLPKDFDGTEGKAIHRLCKRFGWATFAAELRDLVAAQQPDAPCTELRAIVSLCEPLCCDPPELTDERRAACVAIAEELAQAIERWDRKRTAAWYGGEEKRAGVVAGAVRIFATVGATAQLDQFLTHVLEDERHYDLRQVLVPDVKTVYAWLPKVLAAQPAAARLLEHCLAALRTATAQPVEPPADWKREANLGCDCADCRALGRFLHDPAQKVGRFPLAKERRQHLHQQIERHQCDCTHVTEREGRPFTLVCTKTQASYERRLKQYHADQEMLVELEALAGGGRRAVVRAKPGRRKTPK